MLKEVVSWNELVEYKGEIVCIGAGMVFSHIEQLLYDCGVSGKICAIADNDPKKWGMEVSYAGKIYIISSVNELKKKYFRQPLALITCERDKEIIAQLNADRRFDNWSFGSYPWLNYCFKRNIEEVTNLRRTEKCIPPIIHYIWFGNKQIPEEQKNFITGWKKLCVDYQLVLWNESNYDINKCAYTKEAFKEGDYARVSDYARMDILYHYGGFYMDTDVELLKGLDALRGYQTVFAYGEWPVVNSGVICGTVPGNRLIQRLRDEPRNQIHYYDSSGIPDKRTNCFYENEVLKKIGFRGNFTSQLIEETILCSPVYFATIGNYNGYKDITAETVAVHHCAGSWKRKKYD